VLSDSALAVNNASLFFARPLAVEPKVLLPERVSLVRFHAKIPQGIALLHALFPAEVIHLTTLFVTHRRSGGVRLRSPIEVFHQNFRPVSHGGRQWKPPTGLNKPFSSSVLAM
jgi:hypothetical protein